MIDQKTFRENQIKVPLEELLKYPDMFLAWSADGSRILDADPDFEALSGRMQAAGYDLDEIVIEANDFPGVSQVNGAGLFLEALEE